MIANHKPELIFEGEFDEREAMESRDRGYRSHVWVELGKGRRYPVVFYDAARLPQDLEVESRSGNSFIAEPGLIVLPEVTREYMEKAVCKLAEEGFFESLRGTDTGVDAGTAVR
jgi:hypothetical protein